MNNVSEFNIELQKKLIKDGLDLKNIFILFYIVDEIETDIKLKYMWENTPFFHFSYKKIIEDMPILKIKKKALAERLKFLHKKGYIKHLVLKNSKGTNVYIRTTKRVKEIIG